MSKVSRNCKRRRRPRRSSEPPWWDQASTHCTRDGDCTTGRRDVLAFGGKPSSAPNLPSCCYLRSSRRTHTVSMASQYCCRHRSNSHNGSSSYSAECTAVNTDATTGSTDQLPTAECSYNCALSSSSSYATSARAAASERFGARTTYRLWLIWSSMVSLYTVCEKA